MLRNIAFLKAKKLSMAYNNKKSNLIYDEFASKERMEKLS